MHSVDEIKKFLLMPIECTTEENRIFIYKDKIFSSQKYRGLDPDMSDIAIKFYEIIYEDQLKGRSLLDNNLLADKQFCGDTMNSLYSISCKKYNIDKAEWEKCYHCLANFWMLPMPVGHTSSRMVYEIKDQKYRYKDLLFLSKSNPTIRDDMYRFLASVDENHQKIKELFPDYWDAFGDGFQNNHYLGTIYSEHPDVMNYDLFSSNMENRAMIIAKNKKLKGKLSKLIDSIEKN